MPTFDPPATREWDFPRGVAGVSILVAHGAETGVPASRMLRGTGLAEADLADHRQEVTAAQELRVIRNLLASAPPATGAVVGGRYHASSFGALGFALLSSPTLGHAANLALRFLDLSFAFTIPSARVEGRSVIVTVEQRALPGDLRQFLVERDLAAIWSVLRELGGGAPRLGAVWLPFADVAPRCREVFGVDPVARAEGAGMQFDASWLDMPLPQANPHALALSETLCRELVSRRRRRSGVAEQARVMIAQRIADGAPMPEVAAALGLSERSLRRRLADAGTSYRALLDEVRHTLAEELLATGRLRVEDVALRLGYAEASSFILAFRRWTGRTPAESLPSRPGPSPRR